LLREQVACHVRWLQAWHATCYAIHSSASRLARYLLCKHAACQVELDRAVLCFMLARELLSKHVAYHAKFKCKTIPFAESGGDVYLWGWWWNYPPSKTKGQAMKQLMEALVDVRRARRVFWAQLGGLAFQGVLTPDDVERWEDYWTAAEGVLMLLDDRVDELLASSAAQGQAGPGTT